LPPNLPLFTEQTMAFYRVKQVRLNYVMHKRTFSNEIERELVYL